MIDFENFIITCILFKTTCKNQYLCIFRYSYIFNRGQVYIFI